MSLTLIGIMVTVFCLVVVWLFMCAVYVRSGQLAIIGEWGAAACDVKRPGLHFIFWPLYSVMEIVPITTITINIQNFTLNCLSEDATTEKIHFKTNALVGLIPKEISIIYSIDFFQPGGTGLDRGKLNCYFKLRTDSGSDYVKIEEILKDHVQSCISAMASRLGALTIMSDPDEFADKVKKQVAINCAEQQIPIVLIGLKINSPCAFADPAQATAIAATATAQFRKAALKHEKDLEAEGVRRDTEIAKLRVKKEAALVQIDYIRLKTIASACGLDQLPPEQYVAGQLTLQAFEVYKELARGTNNVIWISPSLLQRMGEVFAKYRGGQQ